MTPASTIGTKLVMKISISNYLLSCKTLITKTGHSLNREYLDYKQRRADKKCFTHLNYMDSRK